MSVKSRAPEAPFKEQAERLREFLAAAGVDLKHTTSQQAVARMHGAHDWRELIASASRDATDQEPSRAARGITEQAHFAITTAYRNHCQVLLAPTQKLAILTFVQEARGILDQFKNDSNFRFVGQDMESLLPSLTLMWQNSAVVSLSCPMVVDGTEPHEGPEGYKLVPAKLPKLYGLDECKSFFAIGVALSEAFSMRTEAQAKQRHKRRENSLVAMMNSIDFKESITQLAVQTQQSITPPPLQHDPRELLQALDKVKLHYSGVSPMEQGD